MSFQWIREEWVRGRGKVCFRSMKRTDASHHHLSNARSVPDAGHQGTAKLCEFPKIEIGCLPRWGRPGPWLPPLRSTPPLPLEPPCWPAQAPTFPGPSALPGPSSWRETKREHLAPGGELAPRAPGRHGNQGGADPWPRGPARPRPVAFPRSTWRRPTRKCRCRRCPPGVRSSRPSEAEPGARHPTARGPPALGRPRPLPPVPLHGQATRPRPRPRGGAEARGRRGRRRRERERFARGSQAARAAGGSYYRGRKEEPGRARRPARAGGKRGGGEGGPAARRQAWGRGLRVWAGEL